MEVQPKSTLEWAGIGRRFFPGLVWGVAVLLLWIVTQVFLNSSWAANSEETPEGNRSPASGVWDSETEYSFKWLDSDKKVYVLQNRRYLKRRRVMATIMGGYGASNPYRDTFNLDARVGFFITEDFGIEGYFNQSFNSNNNTLSALLNSGTTALPAERENLTQAGGLVLWAPFYAKINLFNWIMYFDWYLSSGAGVILSQAGARANSNASSLPAFESQNLFSIYFGTGHLYHLSDWLFARVDVLGALYRAPTFGTTSLGAGYSWFINYNINLGVGVRY